MSIDIAVEDLLPLNQAARVLPGRPHISTLWRWHRRGIRGIRLETAVVGGTRYTSRQALQRFVDRTTAAADGQTPPVSIDRSRERAVARADAELDAAGI
jgi:hypothetical protein